jgi:hypothetical protein
MFAAVSAGMGLEHIAPEASATVGIPETFAKGYGTDPVLAKLYKPGDVWPLTLDAEQRRTVSTLCDLIIPADDLGPAASAVGVPEFIDEWVSAPYPQQQIDNPIILQGIAWLKTEANLRFKKNFADLYASQMAAIADDICDHDNAKPEFKKAALFFKKFRNLASAGYYSTQEGWKAIGFVGNITSATFEGPPPEVLKQLDVEQTVK